jgi:hypothetical protein
VAGARCAKASPLLILFKFWDSGLRVSDFLTAMGAFTNADHTINRDFS